MLCFNYIKSIIEKISIFLFDNKLVTIRKENVKKTNTFTHIL